ERVSTGAWFRARIATPFQERSPCHTASYPRRRRAPMGNAPCSALSSWRLTTSGSDLVNQARRLSSRLLMLLMLKVETFTKSLAVESSPDQQKKEGICAIQISATFAFTQASVNQKLEKTGGWEDLRSPAGLGKAVEKHELGRRIFLPPTPDLFLVFDVDSIANFTFLG